jgi:hypothetical protein
MNQKTSKNVLILTFILLFLIFMLIYMQVISVEHFSKNLESFKSPMNSVGPTDNFIMVHDTALDAYDVTNPVLTPDDVIYQTTKYQALMENGWFNDFGNYTPTHAREVAQAPSGSDVISNGSCRPSKNNPNFCTTCCTENNTCNTYCTGLLNVPANSPVPARAPGAASPAPGAPAPAPTQVRSITFPCTVLVAYSNYKDKNSGLDPFINKIISVRAYDSYFAAYPLKDETGNAMYFPGADGMYSLWALSTKNNTIICGWHQYEWEKAPVNSYPNNLVLYVKNVISS